MVIRSLLAGIISILISLVVTPWIIRIARTIGAIDMPNERKIHRQPIPRLGGMVIGTSFLLTFTLLYLFDPWLFAPTWIVSNKGLVLLTALLLMLLLGTWDDLRTLGPGRKFFFQVFAASLCYAVGFRISSITNPFESSTLAVGILEYPLTVLWIVGITNAFNLIDGLDGLAGGVGTIASLTIFSILLLNGEPATALLALIVAGALIGFLRYNFNPAKIFLGDSGSLFTGFLLAMLSIQTSTKGSTAIAILVPILALGLPIMDTLVSMMRRFLGSFLPDQETSRTFLQKLASMFLPDRRHIHHQLLSLGLSHRRAVVTLYLVSCAFGIVACFLTVTNRIDTSLILLAVTVATVAGVRHLRYREMAILRNGVLLPLYDWPVVHRTVFQGFIDLAFCGIAFTASFLLASGQEFTHEVRRELLSLLPIVCGVQISAFYASGLYRSTFRQLGVGDLLKIVRIVALAVILTGIALVFFENFLSPIGIMAFIVDFYLLLTFIAGSRVSFHVLNYLFKKDTRTGRRVVIYGADVNGMLTLQQILNDDTLNLMPIGFLDDSPHLEGKQMNGYRVFGGHWKLPGLLKRYKIDEVLISSNDVRPEVLRRLKQFADAHGIAMARPRVSLERITTEQKKSWNRSLILLKEADSDSVGDADTGRIDDIEPRVVPVRQGSPQ